MTHTTSAAPEISRLTTR